MNGDGHTGFFNGSDCIDAFVVEYVLSLQLPPQGTQCEQDVPFPLPAEPAKTKAMARAGVERGYAGRLAAPLRAAR